MTKTKEEISRLESENRSLENRLLSANSDIIHWKGGYEAAQEIIKQLEDWKESAIKTFLNPICDYGQSSDMLPGSSIVEETIKRAKERDSLKKELEETLMAYKKLNEYNDVTCADLEKELEEAKVQNVLLLALIDEMNRYDIGEVLPTAVIEQIESFLKDK